MQVEFARALNSVRDITAAETELRSILKKQPSNPDACYLLGALLVQKGKDTEAMTLLEKASAAAPNAWGACCYLGRARLQDNDAQSAAPSLEKAASLNPDESAVFHHLSGALKALGRDAEARKASARVAELKRKGMERDQDAVILR